MKRTLRYFWGTIAHPRPTLDALAAEPSLRPALMAACLPVLQVWGNMALHALFGMNWLGTAERLENPTFVAGFGYLRVDVEDYVPVFAGLMLLVAVLSFVLVPGLAHLLSRLWGGQGRFEQMVSALGFACVVPNIVIGATSEWLFSVPMNLISGDPYWWDAAMRGKFGPTVAGIWNTYTGLYLGVQWLWIIVLGSLAIRRIERIPTWAAGLIMVVTFAVWMFLESLFVR